MTEVYVAAGSNVAPEENLARAVAELEKEFPGTRVSPWYRNRAVGFSGDDFINLVAGFSTQLPLAEVLQRLQAIEALCGRARESTALGAALHGPGRAALREPGVR